MVDDGSTGASNNENYRDIRIAVASKIQDQLRPRKRVGRAKNTEDTDVETPSTLVHNVSYQAIAAIPSSSRQDSEEVPIHGFLTLKTIESKVVYCLTFSQELLPHLQEQGWNKVHPADLEEPQLAAPVTIDPDHLWRIRKIIDRKVVDNEKHHKVKWDEKWIPEFELAGARKLIDEFEAKL
jgi:hypothetical protein